MISDQLRTSQGPLARVWLASHWERKISKSQFLQTNLEKTIDAITTNQQSEPIALRLSGQLLLGVVRIYSRKTRYLLEDCNEALVKIKLAFKKGDVNMPDIHQSVANANTITLQDKLTEFDILLPDLPFNSNNNLTEIDPIFDSIGSMSMSQDITLGDMQSGFGNWPLEGGRFDGGGVEAGRRDNGATADNAFNLQELEDPLNNLKLGDDHDNRSINNNAVDFDFDLNDNIDYGMDDNMFNGDREFDNRDASLDTLKDIGIVEDENMFDLDSAMAEPAVRRRKRLVVDQITEIPQEDLRRYVNDASPLVNTRETNTEPVTKSKNVINLVQPSGESLGSDLESMFTRMSNKRRAPAIMSEAQKQARFDDPFATTTTPAAAPTSAFHFDDDGGDFGDDAVFDAAAAAQYTVSP
ncbi:Rec8 like protein-domain-containing protein [Mucor mucedo]|uniref:Rec8 like protein-domain-containing protein n=1 Tax=Mucor mucedo TaxID=29922 RepID=UPI00221F4E97|nr:Rec8 like protein-domain-containing protein [Mucor mucedo]KAI7893229.1 Rec8 like protein-domain-containing protein [Mucor mucedo]